MNGLGREGWAQTPGWPHQAQGRPSKAAWCLRSARGGGAGSWGEGQPVQLRAGPRLGLLGVCWRFQAVRLEPRETATIHSARVWCTHPTPARNQAERYGQPSESLLLPAHLGEGCGWMVPLHASSAQRAVFRGTPVCLLLAPFAQGRAAKRWIGVQALTVTP